MSTANESFIRLFEDIAREVNRRAGTPSSHSVEIEKACERDGLVRRNRTLLTYVRDVRNTLQHPKHRSNGDAVLVSQAFLDEVTALVNQLKNPPTANSVGVPRRNIKTAGFEDRLGDLAETMKAGRFTHIPILNDSDAVVGVFNEAAVFEYLWRDTETIVGRQMKIGDILDCCRLDSGHTESFRFVRPRAPIDDIVDMFAAVQSPSTRLGAVFVTASGREAEPLQRLITPWDVLSRSSDG